jgi:hypothetical protein
LYYYCAGRRFVGSKIETPRYRGGTPAAVSENAFCGYSCRSEKKKIKNKIGARGGTPAAVSENVFCGYSGRNELGQYGLVRHCFFSFWPPAGSGKRD